MAPNEKTNRGFGVLCEGIPWVDLYIRRNSWNVPKPKLVPTQK